MRPISAQIGTHIVVDSRHLSSELNSQITQALTIPNPDKPVALREHLYGAHSMPDTVELMYREGSIMRIPRGFIHSFIRGMQANDMEIAWKDERTSIHRTCQDLKPITLDDYQEMSCKDLLDFHDAMISAPTGSGKTIIALEAMRRSMQRSLLIVEKSSLAAQWITQIRDKLGLEAGYIGEGQWIERDITVALRQSLWAHRDDPAIGDKDTIGVVCFWDRWGMVLLDEAHHAPADTLVDLMQRFTAAFRGGVSATPDRDPLTFPIAQVVIGPVVHETTFEEAEARLIRPRVRVIQTGFDFSDYHPTERRKVWDEKRKRNVTKTIRNNYNEMIDALINDGRRNGMIVNLVMAECIAGHHCLVVSSRRDHLINIRDMLVDHPYGYLSHIDVLFGGESGERATEITTSISESTTGTILLSTVADEGLDIPILDRLFLIYPSRKSAKQKVGRITRRHPGKKDAIVFDFMDKQSLLKDQFRERRQRYYNKDGLEVEMEELVAA